MTTLAIVASFIGQAWAENAKGERRAIAVGDHLRLDETLILEQGSRLDLIFDDGQSLSFVGGQEITPEQRELLQQQLASTGLAPSEADLAEAPAHTLAAADSQQGHNFVQLVRIGEIIEANGFTPVTVARIQELLQPAGIVLPQRDFVRSEHNQQAYEESVFKPLTLTISIDVIAGDDIVNANEAGQIITLSGTVGRDAAAGDRVTVTVNGKTYNTTVKADGKTWQIEVPGSELVQDDRVRAVVDSAEHPANSAEAERPYLVDTKRPGATVELEGAGSDGIYNESEVIDGQVPSRITLDPNTEPGDRIVVTDGKGNELINRPVTQGDIDNGILLNVPVVPGQTEVQVNVELSDPSGNTGGANDSKVVDNLTPKAEIEIDSSPGSNGNYNGNITLDPNTTEAGDTVVVTDGKGNELLNRPITQEDIDKGIQVEVPVTPGQDELELNTTVTDPAGNSSSTSDKQTIDSGTTEPPTMPPTTPPVTPPTPTPTVEVSLEPASGPNGAYNHDDTSDGKVQGTISFDPATTKPGDRVTVTDHDGNPVLDKQGEPLTNYKLSQEDINNGITVELPVSEGQTEVALTAKVSNWAGKSSTDSDTKLVDNLIPRVEVELEPGSGPNGEYNEDDTSDAKVTGTVTLDPNTTEPGDSIKITDKDGKVIIERPITQDDIDNGIVVDVPVSEGQTDVELNVEVRDPAGNSSTGADDKPVDNVGPKVSVELEAGSGSNGKYNADDTQDGQVQGTITFDPSTTAPGDTITVSDKDGNPILDSNGEPLTDYELTQSDIDNGIVVDVPVVQGQTEVELNVVVRDPAGNQDSDSDSKPADTLVVIAELSVDETLVNEGEVVELEYTVTLKDSDGNPVIANNDITVTTSQGNITISAGDSSGSRSIPVQGDDVYIDNETVANEITNIVEDSQGGAVIFENLSYDNTPVSTDINDTIDTVTAKLTVSESAVEEGDPNNLVYTVTLEDADGNPVTANNTVTVSTTLGNIVINAGDSFGVRLVPVQDDSVYIDNNTVSNAITAISEQNANTTGAFEDLAFDNTVVDTVVSDTQDTTTATLTSVGNGDEDNGAVTYTINLDNPAQGSQDFELVLNNGQTTTISVAANATTGSVTLGWGSGLSGGAIALDGYPDADVYLEPDFVLTVDSVAADGSGGNFEDLVVVDNSTDITIADSIDTVNATLTSSGAGDEDSGAVTYTMTLDEPAQGDQDFQISLSNGQSATITVAANATTGSVTLGWGTGLTGGAIALTGYPDADVYLEPDFTLAVDSIVVSGNGGNFEDLAVIDNSSDLTIADSVDITTATLTSTGSGDEDNGSLTYTVTLDNPPQGDQLFSITLSNGQSADIRVLAGATTGEITFGWGSGAVAGTQPLTGYPDSDVYAEPDFILDVTDFSANGTGGNFEQLDTVDSSTDFIIADTVTPTTITLSDVSGEEGQSHTITATLDHAVTGSDLVITLGNGQTITIAVGDTSGTSNPFVIQTDDVYLDAENYTVDISGVAGGNFEQLIDTDTATVTVADTIDTVTATLSVDRSTVNEGDADLVYTVTFTDENGNPVTAQNDVTVQTTQGPIVISAGNSSGTLNVSVPADSVYVDSSTITNAIISASEDNAGQPGSFEDLSVDNTAVNTTVDDVVDTTTLTLNDVTVNEGSGTATITGSLDYAPETELTVYLSNGASLTFGPGYTPGTALSSTPFAINNAEDVYVDASSFELTVTATSGGNFEDLDTSDTATVTVADTSNTVTVSLTVNETTVDEGAADLVYTATLTDENGNLAPANNTVTVTTAQGPITIVAGASSGTLNVPVQADDVYIDGETVSNSITSVTEQNAGSPGSFEDLSYDGTVLETVVNDTTDAVTATLSVDRSTVNEGDADLVYTVTLTDANGNPVTANNDVTVTLSNGSILTITSGNSAGTLGLPIQGDDVYLDGETISTAITAISEDNAGDTDSFENLGYDGTAVETVVNDTIDTVNATLTSTGAGDEDNGSVSYTMTLDEPAQADQDFEITLSNGQTTIITVAANATTGVITLGWGTGLTGGAIALAGYPDADVYLEPDFVLAVDSVVANGNGGNFEDLAVIDNSSDLTIADSVDITTATLTSSGSGDEDNGSLTYTVTLDNPPQGDQLFSITLSNGQTANIQVAAGNTTGDVTFGWGSGAVAGTQPLAGYPDSDVYIETDVELSVTDFIAQGNAGNFEQLDVVDSSTDFIIADSIDTTTATLTSVGSGDEDNGSVTYTVNLSSPAEADQLFSVTLSNGQTASIQVAAGTTSGELTFGWGTGMITGAQPLAGYPDSDVYLELDFELEVTDFSATANGGNFEDLNLVDNSSSIIIADTIDTTTAILSSVGNGDEDNGAVTYTINLNNPAQDAQDFQISLSNGQNVSISVAANATTGSVTLGWGSGLSGGAIALDGYPDADVYLEPDFVLTVDSVAADGSGGNFEDLVVVDNSTDITIADSIDTVNATLTSSGAGDEDSGAVTYTMTLDEPAQGDQDFQISLSNGQSATITVAANATTGTVVFGWGTGLTGMAIALDGYPDSDVYLEPDFVLAVDSIVVSGNGGNFEDLAVIDNSSDLTIADSVDITTATLTSSGSGDEDNGSLTYTVTLDNPPQGDQLFSITLSNGQSADIRVLAGATTGEIIFGWGSGAVAGTQPLTGYPDSDVYIEPNVNLTVTDFSASGSGGNFEQLNVTDSSTDFTLADSIDTTTATLSSVGSGDEDNGSVTYTIALDNPTEAAQNFELNLSNGQTVNVTVAANATTGSITLGWGSGLTGGAIALDGYPDADVYLEPDFVLTVDSVAADGNGGNFENLAVVDNSSDVVIADTIDAVYVQISVDQDSVVEGGTLTYTVELVDGNGDPVTVAAGKDVTVNLSWSGAASAADVDNLPASIVITGGNSESTFTVSSIDDGVVEYSESLIVTLSGVLDNGGTDKGFENLLISSSNNSATAELIDKPTISALDGNGALAGQVTVFEKGLNDAGDDSETAVGTLRVTAPTGLESIDVGGTTITLAQLENLGTNPITVTVSGHGELTLTNFTPTATANGKDAAWDISYSYELATQQDHDVANPNELLENIALGVSAKSADGLNAISGSGTLGVLVIDDVPVVNASGNVLAGIQVTEDELGATDWADYSGAFITDFGADGAAINDSVVYSFQVNNPTGLVDTATNDDITLSIDANGVVEGRVAGSNELAFTVSVDANGIVTLNQSRAIKHGADNSADDDLVSLPERSLSLVASATDGDGDTASATVAIGDKLSFADSEPVISGQPSISEIDEKHLATGSEPVIANTSVTTNLNIDFAADGPKDLIFLGDTNGSKGQEALLTALNNSGNADIELLVVGDTITAQRDPGGPNEETVFTVTLSVDGSGQAQYTFELLGSMHHFDANVMNQLPFNYRASDGDDDSVDGVFVVAVIDDVPKAEIAIETNEDTPFGPFTLSADARSDNITIQQSAGGPDVIANGDGSFTVDHGTVVINADGTLTFTPDENYSNHGGTDSFFVTIQEDNGPAVTTEVSVNVLPVADAPDLEDDKALFTDEDVSVSLGLSLPVITDDTDQNSTDVGDDPERLGEITLSLNTAPAGTTLTKGDGTPLTVNADGNYTIVIVGTAGGMDVDTNLHVSSGLPTTDVNYLTQAEYEAIAAKPADDRHENFEVEVSVDSFEVDGSGNKLTGVAGANSTQTIAVDVYAVTDPVGLKVQQGTAQADVNVVISVDEKTADITVNEDNSFNLTSILNPDAFVDTDGSETRFLGLHGLPDGSTVTVGGTSYVIGEAGTPTFNFGDGNGPVFAVTLAGNQANLPNITITPPENFSGDFVDSVTVTLAARDSDSDNSGVTPLLETDAVTLNLHVNPVAGDVIAGDVSTTEDTAVAFMQHIEVIDTNNSNGNSSEIITKVSFEVPEDWVVNAPGTSTDWIVTEPTALDPSYTIEAIGGYNLENILSDFTITPAPHSSADQSITVTVTSVDSNNLVNGLPASDAVDTDLVIKVEVTPVAEIVDGDTDGNLGDDLTIMPDHEYQSPASEDTWFDLGTDANVNSFLFSNGWANEDGESVDGSEKTFALLTPKMIAGDGSNPSALGAKFKWVENGIEKTVTYTGSPVEVPMDSFNSLEFTAAPNFAGQFEIKVQAKTVDYDEDYPGDLTKADIAISGEATLTQPLIKPVADKPTTGLTARVNGIEDEPMDLSIRPTSRDPNEVFNITLGGIPDGAALTYGDYTITESGVFDVNNNPVTVTDLTVSTDGSGSWSVEIQNFDSNLPLRIQPPLDSNEEFVLAVSSVTVDTVTIEGVIYTDTSAAENLTIVVSPKGVADPAIFELEPNQEFTEEVVENFGISITDLVNTAELKDADGSETLSFKVSGLPAGFTLEGATFIGGTGTGREWSFKDLAGVVIKAPTNFNGVLNFNLFTITTENDGDSLTVQHPVSVSVTPTPEAGMNLSDTILEDTSTKLDFGVVYQNGDIDEFISEVWINQADLSAADVTLTLGANGTSLADAANNANSGVVDEGGYYKVSGTAIDNVFALGSPNMHGSTSFGVRYQVTDPGNDGLADSLSDPSSMVDSTYTITIAAVTDQDFITVTAGGTTTLEDPGSFSVVLDIGNDDGMGGNDYDGSEMLTRIVVSGVPEGVVLLNPNSHLIGEGTWVIISDTPMDVNAPLTPTLEFQVQTVAGGLADHEITITVISEDASNGIETEDSATITLTTTFTAGTGSGSALINEWAQTAFEPTEDSSFSLVQAIAGEIQDGVAGNGFTITLKDLPPGTQVSGMQKTTVGGVEVWSVSGSGDNADLQALLATIEVTPPENWNSNQGPFEYNATLSTHVPSGGRAQESIDIDQAVIPVTDEAVINITAPPVDEGQSLSITIDVSNPADDPNWTLIGNTLYLQLTEPAELQGGSLMDGSTTLTTTEFSAGDVPGMPAGDYYVIDLGTNRTIDLSYQPEAGDEYKNGDIGFNAWVQGVEDNAANTVTSTATQTATIEAINNGYDLSVGDVNGTENPSASNKENAIVLNIEGTGLVDSDGSESIESILLKNIPNDFLVFIGDDAASATQAELANNAGGSTLNTWLLGDELPNYIAILPPKHWSGTLSNLAFSVISGEASLNDKHITDVPFELVVAPVADGIELTPTTSIGDEGQIVGLHLNAEMKDLQPAGASDQSTESATLELKGLGEHASFYIDGVLSMNGVSYDNGTDTYTLSGLSQDDIDKLGFIQANDAISTIEVRAKTVESGGTKPESAWTDWKSISADIDDQFSTSGSDTLLWTGSAIDGQSGDDTIQLRFGESLTGDDLSGSLSNIETLSMEGAGANTITGLSMEDVIDITDEDNILKILGDSNDTLSLDASSGWALDESAGITGFDVYNVVSDNTVLATLQVQQGGVVID